MKKGELLGYNIMNYIAFFLFGLGGGSQLTEINHVFWLLSVMGLGLITISNVLFNSKYYKLIKSLE